MERALQKRQNFVRAALKHTEDGRAVLRPKGKRHLVAVAVLRPTDDGCVREVDARVFAEERLHVCLFYFKLLLVRQMTEGAPAALAKKRATCLAPLCGRRKHLDDMRKNHPSLDAVHGNFYLFAGERIRYEKGAVALVSAPFPLHTEVFDGEFQQFFLFHFIKRAHQFDAPVVLQL